MNELPGLVLRLTPFCYLIYVYFIMCHWFFHYHEISKPKWKVCQLLNWDNAEMAKQFFIRMNLNVISILYMCFLVPLCIVSVYVQ